MVFPYFIAGFITVGLLGWAVHALTHPVTAVQGVLIFLCKVGGVIMGLAGAGIWMGHALVQALPAFGIMGLFFLEANRLESRWWSW